ASYAFAIPIDRARTIVDDLLRFGKVRLGWLGVRCVDGEREGCVIAEVEAGSPAARAGLREGDVVRAVGSDAVQSAADFAARAAHVLDGQELSLKLARGVVKVHATYLDAGHAIERARRRLALEVAGGRSGVTVSRVDRGGIAARIGVRPGD